MQNKWAGLRMNLQFKPWCFYALHHRWLCVSLASYRFPPRCGARARRSLLSSPLTARRSQCCSAPGGSGRYNKPRMRGTCDCTRVSRGHFSSAIIILPVWNRAVSTVSWRGICRRKEYKHTFSAWYSRSISTIWFHRTNYVKLNNTRTLVITLLLNLLKIQQKLSASFYETITFIYVVTSKWAFTITG